MSTYILNCTDGQCENGFKSLKAKLDLLIDCCKFSDFVDIDVYSAYKEILPTYARTLINIDTLSQDEIAELDQYLKYANNQISTAFAPFYSSEQFSVEELYEKFEDVKLIPFNSVKAQLELANNKLDRYQIAIDNAQHAIQRKNQVINNCNKKIDNRYAKIESLSRVVNNKYTRLHKAERKHREVRDNYYDFNAKRNAIYQNRLQKNQINDIADKKQRY